MIRFVRSPNVLGIVPRLPTKPGARQIFQTVRHCDHSDGLGRSFHQLRWHFANNAGTRNPSKNFEISLVPSTAVLSSGDQQQFSATLTSTGNTAVTWKASAGVISPNGLYTAPVVTTPTKTTVIASSVEDGSRVAISEITVNPQFKLMIDVASLPKSTVGFDTMLAS